MVSIRFHARLETKQTKKLLVLFLAEAQAVDICS